MSDGTVAADLSTIYVLANGTNGVGFYLLKDGYVHEGKAYLQIPPSANVRQFIGFGDDSETTGIEELKDGRIEGWNNSSTEELKSYYNLNGQRVANPSKGLYIVNGKKVVITI